MTVQAKFLLCAVAMSGLASFAAASPAQALTMQECSAKYKEAKTAGTLNGQKWNDFRKAQCGADATAAPAPAAAPAAAEAKPLRPPVRWLRPRRRLRWVTPCSPRQSTRNMRRRLPARRGCIPAWISTRANKAGNANGGLKWIQKGGGYYSECNKHLKGPA